LPLLLLLLAALSGCGSDSPTAPDDRFATLSGRVTRTGGAPEYPASVAILEGGDQFRYQYVNTEGRYEFQPLRAGNYIIVLTLGQGAGVREVLREPIVLAPGPNVRDFVVR
jgi:hypothetical protein